MNKYLLCFITLMSFQLLLSQEANIVTKNTRGQEKMLGKITKEGLASHSFETWFTPNYDAYEPDEKIVQKLRRKLKKYQITVFMGTWCGDSKREVPRLFKLLEAADFPEKKIHVIGLDNTRAAYKQGPNGEEKGFRIHRVPTMIVSDKKGREIGRIVEHPVESLEADLLNICRKKTYVHSYQIVTNLQNIMETKDANYLQNNAESFATQLQPYSKSFKELDTFGYVLLRAGEFDKAIAVLTINATLFPNQKNSYDSLAEAYYENKQYEQAKLYYQKVLVLDASDQNARKMLEQLQ